MARSLRHGAFILMATFLIWAIPGIAQQGAKDGQWRFYAGENGSTGYSPLDQINRDNVKNLQVA
jgi:glucose dehydrogenase